MGNNQAGTDTGSTGAIKVSKVQYLGRVCDKHPELKGLRYKKNSTCMGCTWAHTAERRRRIEEYPALVEEVEILRAMVAGNPALETITHYRDRAVALALELGEAKRELEEKRGALHRLQILGNLVLKIGRRVVKDDHCVGAHPGHCHVKPGHWDRDGSVCQECADWARMMKLARAK